MVTFKEFFSFKNNRFFWLNLVAMIIVVIAIALGTLQWLDNYTRHGEAVVVPYLTINMDSAPKVSVPDIMDNSSLRQAEAKLRALGFRVTEPEYISGEKDWVYSVTYKGRTLNAGDKVPHEALLTLHVGNGNDELTNDSTLTDSTAIGDDDTPVVDKSWF